MLRLINICTKTNDPGFIAKFIGHFIENPGSYIIRLLIGYIFFVRMRNLILGYYFFTIKTVKPNVVPFFMYEI